MLYIKTKFHKVTEIHTLNMKQCMSRIMVPIFFETRYSGKYCGRSNLVAPNRNNELHWTSWKSCPCNIKSWLGSSFDICISNFLLKSQVCEIIFLIWNCSWGHFQVLYILNAWFAVVRSVQLELIQALKALILQVQKVRWWRSLNRDTEFTYI